MSALLGRDISELSNLALKAKTIYPIASRCGVFSKTDVQNLLARNALHEDLAASIFHAVAMQCIGNLARGFDIKPKLFFCGGPMAFIPALRKAFQDELKLSDIDCIICENAAIVPAWGAALAAASPENNIAGAEKNYLPISALEKILLKPKAISKIGGLPRLFEDEASDILKQHGKNITLLKIDDVNNVGSLKLRLRSLIESLKFKNEQENAIVKQFPKHTAVFREEDKRRTIIFPYISEYMSPVIAALLQLGGYKAEMLPPSNEQTLEFGLKYSNNEICYPATICVGDIIKALCSGRYNRENIAVGISQTGGQCRATNYLSLIKKAMANSGYGDVPVIAVGVGTSPINEQPGMHFSLAKVAKAFITGFAYADCIAQMYYSTVVREVEKGTSAKLRDIYVSAVQSLLRQNKIKEIFELLRKAAIDFEKVKIKNEAVPAIGIVGEIFVKYNSFSNKNVVNWLIEQGVEPVIPNSIDFMIQDIVNNKVNIRENIAHHSLQTFGITVAMSILAKSTLYRADKACRPFSRYRKFGDIEEKASKGAQIVNLAAQFGGGWLIPDELVSFAEAGIYNAVSMQPFGCIANHIVAKGIEKRVKKLYPKMNLLFLDFDSGTSEANVLNRLHFMIKNARDQAVKVK